jgi:hypothetical protein
VLTLLDWHFARLELPDPDRHLRTAIAGYPLNPILAGISVLDAKRHACTLPDSADARYLLGIVKNVAAKTEGELFAEVLYKNRIEARDMFLAAFRAQREALRSEPDTVRVLSACVENAMLAEGAVGRTFWLDAVVETLREQSDSERERLHVHAARLIEASFTSPHATATTPSATWPIGSCHSRGRCPARHGWRQTGAVTCRLTPVRRFGTAGG